MQSYRAYLIENGHVGSAVDFSCVDDDDAIKQAGQMLDGHVIELWQADRRVRLFKAHRRQPQPLTRPA